MSLSPRKYTINLRNMNAPDFLILAFTCAHIIKLRITIKLRVRAAISATLSSAMFLIYVLAEKRESEYIIWCGCTSVGSFNKLPSSGEHGKKPKERKKKKGRRT